MKNMLIGFVLGVIVQAIGFTVISKHIENGIGKVQSFTKPSLIDIDSLGK
jgi:heme/copper-type cytochrome/quinol oxidase subunit 4